MKFLPLLLTIALVFTGCTQSTTQIIPEADVIQLTFTPVPFEALEEKAPESHWILGKSIYFGALPGQTEITVHLFVEEIPEFSNMGTVYAFLEHQNTFYGLGVVSSYGLDVSIDYVDRNNDQIKELEIIGILGATYAEMKLLSFNEAENKWYNLLTMGSPLIVDLEGDGLVELAAVSTGSLPGFVDIYQWRNDTFEKASITEALDTAYANLYYQDDQWIIETGKWENHQIQEPQFYRYEMGKLYSIAP